MFFLTLLISVFTVFALFSRGYFPMHDDLQVMRIFQLEKCFADGQIPCRWAADMAFGYGQAMFNFYSAFPYYLGVIIRQISPFSIVDTVKILFALSLVASGVGMYFLAKELFGKWGGFLSSSMYLLAPYRAVNVYVRGAMAEAFSLAILPFLWLAIYQVIKKPSFRNVSFLALSAAAQLSTHNISTLIYAPFTAVWALFWLYRSFSKKGLWAIFLGGAFGAGLAAFFILPVFLEKGLIREEVFTSDYSYFAAHFVSLKQLFFSRFWGYGGSIFGENDHMSFQVGWPHWWVAVIIGLGSVYKFIKERSQMWLMAAILTGMGVLALFMTHQKSHIVWESISTLSFVQFPWRFLGVAVFFFSLASGALLLTKQTTTRRIVLAVIILSALILNYQYFRPEMHFYDETDTTKLSGELFYIQQKSAYLDYLPKTVREAPVGLAPLLPQVVSGEAEVPNFTKTSSTFFFDANVYIAAEIDVPIIYFPDWEVYILEGQGVKIDNEPGGKHGTIHISLPVGKHMVYGRFVNTPARTAGNIITLASAFLLAAGATATLNKRKFLGLK